MIAGGGCAAPTTGSDVDGSVWRLDDDGAASVARRMRRKEEEIEEKRTEGRGVRCSGGGATVGGGQRTGRVEEGVGRRHSWRRG